MKRQEIIEVCARNVADMFDPYELADVGADELELFQEAVRLLGEDPKAVHDWMMEA